MGGWKYPFGMTTDGVGHTKACISRNLHFMSTTCNCSWSMDRTRMESQSKKISEWLGYGQDFWFLQRSSQFNGLTEEEHSLIWQCDSKGNSQLILLTEILIPPTIRWVVGHGRWFGKWKYLKRQFFSAKEKVLTHEKNITIFSLLSSSLPRLSPLSLSLSCLRPLSSP